jgi:predicted type IV restriction endonuclease
MFTVCANGNCRQRYQIKPEVLGVMARCKKCNTVFQVTEFVEPAPVIDFEPPGEEEGAPPEGETQEQSRRRRSSREIMAEHIDRIKQNVNTLIPRLNHSHKKQDNESDTRLLINEMLQDVLGYKIEDIKTEQRIEGRKADYVLAINGEDSLVIEAKRIGASLRQQQIFQATSYAAYSGIRWAVLTNAWVWQLYHISTGEKIETDLIFTVDMMDGLNDQEAYWFYLISKNGLARKNLLDNIWRKVSALCCDNIVNAILSDEVIARIRQALHKQTGYRATDEELRTAIEENVLQL